MAGAADQDERAGRDMTKPRTRKPAAREPAALTPEQKRARKYCREIRERNAAQFKLGETAYTGDGDPVIVTALVLSYADPLFKTPALARAARFPPEAEFRIHRKGFCPDTLRRIARELRAAKRARFMRSMSADVTWRIAHKEVAEAFESEAKRYAREARQAVKPRAKARQ